MDRIFFCKTLDIFLKHDKIIVVGRIKSLSNKNKILYKEILSIEVVLKKDIEQIESIDNKLDFLVRYLKNVYHFDNTNKYFNADIEITLRECIIGMIDNQTELFAKYIFDRLNI